VGILETRLDETGETLGAFTVGFVEAIIHLSHPPKTVSSNGVHPLPVSRLVLMLL
jgi:hypothetical protein